MDAYINLFSSLPSTSPRTFVSTAPGPVLLIWSNNSSLPNITGVSVVEGISNGQSFNSPISGRHISTLIYKRLQMRIPFLYIRYDINLEYIFINKNKHSLSEAAQIISSSFSLDIDNSDPKIANKKAMVNDPFHIWSRKVFSGVSVKKTDIDAITLNNTMDDITSIIEVKRSAAQAVGVWRPYVREDSNNYLMTMNLSNNLRVPFYTVHHDMLSETSSLDFNRNIDVFTYQPKKTSPNSIDLKNFASEENRLIYNVKCWSNEIYS